MWSVKSRLYLQPSVRRFSHASIRSYFFRRDEEPWWIHSPSVDSGLHFRLATGAVFKSPFRVRHMSVTVVARGESEQGEGRHSKLQCPRCSHPLPSATSVASKCTCSRGSFLCMRAPFLYCLGDYGMVCVVSRSRWHSCGVCFVCNAFLAYLYALNLYR